MWWLGFGLIIQSSWNFSKRKLQKNLIIPAESSFLVIPFGELWRNTFQQNPKIILTQSNYNFEVIIPDLHNFLRDLVAMVWLLERSTTYTLSVSKLLFCAGLFFDVFQKGSASNALLPDIRWVCCHLACFSVQVIAVLPSQKFTWSSFRTSLKFP